MRGWLVMLAGAAVLVGCGVFFAFQNLGHADQYASVASFFLALLTAIVSVLALTRSKRNEQRAESSRQNHPPGRGWTLNLFRKNGVVVQGDRSVVTINKTLEVPSKEESRQNP
jgi:hypothetical protein